MKSVKISDIKLNQKVVILDIVTNQKIKNRLISMGLNVGSVVSVINRTIIGKNIIVNIDLEYNKNNIIIDKKEAECIMVIPFFVNAPQSLTKIKTFSSNVKGEIE